MVHMGLKSSTSHYTLFSQPTYDAEFWNRTRATLVGGECSHHCAIPAHLTDFFISHLFIYLFIFVFKTVVPSSQYNCHLEAVNGEIQDVSPGVYILVFDNSFSRYELLSVYVFRVF